MTDFAALLREAGCDTRVIRHCRAVTGLALELAGEDPLYDRDLVEAGGMLHDIGRSTTHGIGHAQAGAGLTADECALLRLVPRDCVPVTPEERLVAYADKLVAGDRLVSMEREIARSFALPHRSRRRMYRLWRETALLTG